MFYQGIGKRRISRAEREAALRLFQSLRKDEFSDYEIAFAVDWTIKPENTREKPHSFGILSSTIGSAVEVLEKSQAREDQQEAMADQQEVKHERQAEEKAAREDMAKIKESMSPADRTKLRDCALEELQDLGVYEESMISDVLISIHENQILKREQENLTATEQETRLTDTANQ